MADARAKIYAVDRPTWRRIGLDLETLDHAVGLKGGHDEVEQPKGEQEHGRDEFRYKRSAQFTADRLDSSHQQHHDHEASLATEQGDGEGQTAS